MQQEDERIIYYPRLFRTSQQPQKYVEGLIARTCGIMYPQASDFSKDDVGAILKRIRFGMTEQQIGDIFSSLNRDSVLAAAKFHTDRHRQHRVYEVIAQLVSRHLRRSNKRSMTESVEPRRADKIYGDKLPVINKIATVKLYEQMLAIAALMDQIQQERIEYGLVPMDLEGKVELGLQNVPYNPHLHEMNRKIFTLRKTAEQKLQQFIQMAKGYPLLAAIIKKEVEVVGKECVEQNGKKGRLGAMKAHRRMIERSNQKIASIQKTRERLYFMPYINSSSQIHIS